MTFLHTKIIILAWAASVSQQKQQTTDMRMRILHLIKMLLMRKTSDRVQKKKSSKYIETETSVYLFKFEFGFKIYFLCSRANVIWIEIFGRQKNILINQRNYILILHNNLVLLRMSNYFRVCQMGLMSRRVKLSITMQT